MIIVKGFDCMRVCVCACMRACVHVCVRVGARAHITAPCYLLHANLVALKIPKFYYALFFRYILLRTESDDVYARKK